MSGANEYSGAVGKYSLWSTMPGLTPSPCGHSWMVESWPWFERGDPMVEEEAEALERLDDAPVISPSSGYMPGLDRPGWNM